MQAAHAALVPSEGSSRASKPSHELPALLLPHCSLHRLFSRNARNIWVRREAGPENVPPPQPPHTESNLLQKWVTLVEKWELNSFWGERSVIPRSVPMLLFLGRGRRAGKPAQAYPGNPTRQKRLSQAKGW